MRAGTAVGHYYTSSTADSERERERVREGERERVSEVDSLRGGSRKVVAV